MGQHDMRCCEPDFIEVCDVAAPGLAFDDLNLVRVLRRMSVHQHPAFTSKPADSFQQLAAAAHRKPGRKTIADSPVSRAVPTLEQLERLGDRVVCLFAKT